MFYLIIYSKHPRNLSTLSENLLVWWVYIVGLSYVPFYSCVLWKDGCVSRRAEYINKEKRERRKNTQQDQEEMVSNY